jgi:tRNA 2-thiouridine synthesizing protein D
MPDDPEFLITLAHHKDDPKHITLAFTFGLKALEKGYKTAILLLLNGVHVGLSGYNDDIDIGEPFLPVKDLLEVYLSEGGELLVCGSCWKNSHLPDSDRLANVKVITADRAIDMLMSAKSTLQLN